MDLRQILTALREKAITPSEASRAIAALSNTAPAHVAHPGGPARAAKQAEVSQPQLQEDLVGTLAEALFLDPGRIDVAQQFINLGLDSIVAVEWVNALNARYGQSWPA